MSNWKARIANLKRDIRALGLALMHPRTPWYAKAAALCVVAYAISPIDLIPDPIPVLGHLDDVILLPLGIWLVVKLIPREVLEECRERAANAETLSARLKWGGAVMVVLIWIAVLGLAAWCWLAWGR